MAHPNYAVSNAKDVRGLLGQPVAPDETGGAFRCRSILFL